MSIELAKKYAPFTDELFKAESKLSLLTNTDFDWTGAHSVSVWKISTVPMNNYSRNRGADYEESEESLSRFGKIIDLDAQTEEMLLKRRAVENAFEKLYGERPEKIEQLADFFSGAKRGDAELEEAVLKIYDFLMSIPFYSDWVHERAEYYGAGFKPESDPLARLYTERLEGTYRRILAQAEYAGAMYVKLCGSASKAIEEETDRIRLMLKNLGCAEYDWDMRVTQPEQVKTRISFPRGMSDEEKEVSEKIKEIRTKYKKELDKTGESIFTIEEINDDYRIHAEVLSSLYDVIEIFAHELDVLKIEKNALGFSDAEQLAIRLLAQKEENGNIYKKTPIGLCPISAGSAAMLRFQKCSRPHPVPFSCPPLNTLLTLYAADGEKFTGLFG